MPKFKYQVVIEGEVEAPKREAAILWLTNSLNVSVNMMNSVKNIGIDVKPDSGLVVVDSNGVDPRARVL